jgi:hypothetical protein
MTVVDVLVASLLVLAFGVLQAYQGVCDLERYVPQHTNHSSCKNLQLSTRLHGEFLQQFVQPELHLYITY